MDDGTNIKINETGNFQIKIDLFKKGGGESESERLKIPLLGKIPLSNDIVTSTDDGEPIVEKDPNHKASQIYLTIVDKILSYHN